MKKFFIILAIVQFIAVCIRLFVYYHWAIMLIPLFIFIFFVILFVVAASMLGKIDDIVGSND